MPSLSVLSDSLPLHGLLPVRFLCPWDSPGKNTAVGFHALLQVIFPTQGSNPGLLHCRRIWIPYHLSHQGSLFKVYSLMFWYIYTLWNNHYNQTNKHTCYFYRVQFTSVAQLCPTLCDPMVCSMPDFPVHQQLLELAQTHIHQVSDTIQPSHPVSSPSPLAFKLSLFMCVLRRFKLRCILWKFQGYNTE